MNQTVRLNTHYSELEISGADGDQRGAEKSVKEEKERERETSPRDGRQSLLYKQLLSVKIIRNFVII